MKQIYLNFRTRDGTVLHKTNSINLPTKISEEPNLIMVLKFKELVLFDITFMEDIIQEEVLLGINIGFFFLKLKTYTEEIVY